jgi:hypothetical protein
MTALQADDMRDAPGFGKRQKLFRFGGAGRKRPLTVDVFASRYRGFSQPRVLGAGSQDRNEIDVGAGDEILLATESMADVELCRLFFRGFFLAARYRHDLEFL